MKKFFTLIFMLICINLIGFAQNQGVYSASGQGKGTTKEAAIEAAQLDAINTLVFTVLHRDTLYRDLFASEALRNGRILKQETQKTPLGPWQATVTLEIDEGLAEALYVGRYSTTLTSLLDQAEDEIPSIENLLQQGGQAESQGNLGSAETYYTQALAQTDTILRYLNPVDDGYFFSSQGKRKAPELKILFASYKESCTKGIDRVRKAQSQLNVAQKIQQVLEIYDQIEQALGNIEKSRDALSQIATSPRGYTTEQLESAQLQCRDQQNALAGQKSQFTRASEGLGSQDAGGSESYLAKRTSLLEIRLKGLEQQFSSINGSLSRELLWRSSPVTALRWAVNHEPSQYFSLGIRLPGGLKPGDEGPDFVAVPFQIQAAAEGALALDGNSGLWGKSRLQAGSEYLFNTSLLNVRQELVLGFYRRSLLGLGLRWDWNREGQKPITAIEAVWGIPGNSLGQRRPHPLWVTTLSWEIPRETQHVLSYVNGGMESILKPNSYIGFILNLSSRIRNDSELKVPSWVGSASLVSQFRLPVLRPFQWTIGWEGDLTSPLTDMGIKTDAVRGAHGFTFGIGYLF
jgi:hypothetical protein